MNRPTRAPKSLVPAVAVTCLVLFGCGSADGAASPAETATVRSSIATGDDGSAPMATDLTGVQFEVRRDPG